MPRITVAMNNQDQHEIRDMPIEDAAALVEDFQTGDGPVITLFMGEMGNHDVVHLARAGISSIWIEGE